MKVYCVADEETVRGFRLAGVPGQVVATSMEAEKAVAAAAERPDCSVIILTERVASGIRPQVDAMRLQRNRPLIVEIPGPEGPLPGRKSMSQLVQEAVGIRIG